MTMYFSKSTTGFYDSNIHKVMPEDAVEISSEYYQILLEGQSEGKEITHTNSDQPVLKDKVVTLADRIKQYDTELTYFIDEKAKSLNYANIYTAISFRNDPNPKFAAEAEALFLWRSAVWTYVNDLLEESLEDLRLHPEHTLPGPLDVIASLPAFIPPTL